MKVTKDGVLRNFDILVTAYKGQYEEFKALEKIREYLEENLPEDMEELSIKEEKDGKPSKN